MAPRPPCGANAPWEVYSVQSEIEALTKRQEDARVRLENTLAAVSEAEQRQLLAMKRAKAAECRAEVMELGAEAAGHVSRCSLAQASAAKCQAQLSKARADNTMLGCLFGIGAAAISGGVAAPYAIAGCGLGRAAGEGDETCPDADCDLSVDAAQQLVLQAHHLTLPPLCGGQVGAELRAASAKGVHVDDVVVGTTASKLGILAGDVLFSVNNTESGSSSELARALSKVRGDRMLHVRVHRQAQVVSLAGPLEGDKLGIVVGASEVVDDAFVRVSAVIPGSGADAAHLQPGDRLIQIDAAPVPSVTAAYGLIALADEGTSFQLTYERAGKMREATVTLGPRSNLHAF